MQNTDRQHAYTRISDKIVAWLEHWRPPWMKRWSADDAAVRIARALAPQRPSLLRHQHPHAVASTTEQGFTAPIWMTLKQAIELNTHI